MKFIFLSLPQRGPMTQFSEQLTFFSKTIRQKRHDMDISQEKMSEIIGCHPNAIGRLERGHTRPTFLMLLKIAKALKISPKDLFPY